MSKQSLSLLTLTVVAAGIVAANRFVTPAGIQAGAAANTYGVAETSAVSGDKFPVTSHGTAIVETGGAIAAGALVETDAQGRAVTRSAGAIVARLAPGEVATAAGQFVEVILINN